MAAAIGVSQRAIGQGYIRMAGFMGQEIDRPGADAVGASGQQCQSNDSNAAIASNSTAPITTKIADSSFTARPLWDRTVSPSR